MNNPFTKKKKLEQIRKDNNGILQYVQAKVDKLEHDYFGNVWGLSTGFKTATESSLRHLNKTVDDLTKRVKELENVIRLSGIVEELDTTDVVKLPRANFTLADVIDGQANVTRQFVVNKVK